MHNNDFKQLFLDELKDIFSAENQIVEALPKVIKTAENPDLKKALKTHLAETEQQLKRLKTIFQLLKETEEEETCEAMQGMIQECDEVTYKYGDSLVRDAAIIAACQRIEHYEIAVYGTLRTFAKQLDLNQIADLLQETLDEEGNADKKLTEIAEGGFFTAGVNQKASKK